MNSLIVPPVARVVLPCSVNERLRSAGQLDATTGRVDGAPATASTHAAAWKRERVEPNYSVPGREEVLQQHAAWNTRRALHLRWIDRALLIWLYRRCPRILHAITIVKPETVVRWHRKGFDAYWQWKSRSRGGRPRIAKEVRDGPVLSSAEAATAAQAAKVRVETMDSARRQATSCARVLLTISESVPNGPTTRHMPGRFCLGPTERAPWQASVRGA